MMKTIANLIILFFCISINAQNNQFFEAKYNIYYNTDVPQTRKGTLQIDLINKHSIFLIKKKDSIKVSNSGVVASEDGLSVNITYKDFDKFIEIDFKENKIISKENFKNKVYLVEDEPYNFDWNLKHSEEKKIGHFLCKKATTYYRGRNYTAWYTIEIPLNYGPYKFHGLPGLIVSVNDETERYVWELISYKKNAKSPQFKDNIELNSIINVKTFYTKIRYPSESNKRNIVQSRLPKGIKLISVNSDKHIRKGIETKFEWEEDGSEKN